MTQDATTWWILLWVFCLVDLRLWAGLTYDLLDWVRTDRHRPNRLLIIVIAVVGVLGIIVIELTASNSRPSYSLEIARRNSALGGRPSMCTGPCKPR